MRQLLLQITVWEVKGARNGIRGPGNELESVFYGKLTHTAIPKILSVSPLTTKAHPDKVKKNLQGSFFIIYEKVDF